jgi:hypothetical protein
MQHNLAVGCAVGVVPGAGTVLLGDQGPDGAAGQTWPLPDADPASGQEQKASRTPPTNPVGLGQIMVAATRTYGVWLVLSGPDDGEIGWAIGGWFLSSREA